MTDSKERAFKIPAYLVGLSLLKDGGGSIRFSTQELTAEDMFALKQYHNAFGWLLFKENEIEPEELPTEDAELEGKTPSKRLYNVLYAYYRQKKEKGSMPDSKMFNQFYREQMEAIIEHFKDKLDN